MDVTLNHKGVAPANKIIVKVLEEASQLLQRKGWNKFSMARGPHGEAVGPNSENATCYCLSGALVKAWRTIDPENEDFYFEFFEGGVPVPSRYHILRPRPRP